MFDFDKATKILTEHFANLTPEQFEVNLREYCPELFPETIDNPDNIKDTNLYQQGHRDSKLQIIPKLLDKGLSTQEVAELLELDIHKVEETAAHNINPIQVCADNELGALLQGLDGEYIILDSSGDPIRSSDVLPKGKNMHALDPQSIPTEAAVKSAKVVVDRLLERQMRDNNGQYPETIGKRDSAI